MLLGDEEHWVREGLLRLVAMGVEDPGCWKHLGHGSGVHRRYGNDRASEIAGQVPSSTAPLAQLSDAANAGAPATPQLTGASAEALQ